LNITDLFIKRPILAIAFNLCLLLVGIQALSGLPVRQYPRSDSAIVTITTAYVGADSDLVRGYITTPIERVIASADGIDYIESASTQGLSTITIHLRLNFDTSAALSQIQAKVSQVRNELPPEAESPIIDVQSSDSRFASVYLSFYSDFLEQNQITDYLIRVVQPRLSAIAGVQRADILGARTFAMRIWLDPVKMAAREISPTLVQASLRANNYLATLGSSKGAYVTVDLNANTDLVSVDEFKELIIKSANGASVRLKDIAEVSLGAESYNEEVRFDGEKATFIGVWVLPNANSLEVIKRVRAALPELQNSLPSGMKLSVPYDATKYIEDALTEVTKTLLETVVIVIGVIYLFIGSLRSVLVPVVAIPLSLIGGGIIMYLAGFTVNLLTLLAIVLAVGLVVDDAIVMLENIERYVEEGLKPFDAAIKGARELVLPTIAMTLTLATVYAPIAFQGGLTGALFREFALTLSGAVIMSGIVAITLSPMMSSYLVRKKERTTKLDRAFKWLENWYGRVLTSTLNARYATLAVALLTILCIPALYLFSAQELAPREDQGIVFGIVQGSPNASIEQTTFYTEQIGKIFLQIPERANTFQTTNPTGGFSGIVTKPWGERNKTTTEIEGEMWGKAASVPGVRVIMTTPPPLPGGSDFPVELVISTTDEPEKIVQFANVLVGEAFQSGVFVFADTDLKFDLPAGEIIFNRDKVAQLGLTLAEVGADLNTFLSGNYINRFSMSGRSYKVIPQVTRNRRLNPEDLLQFYIGGNTRKLVPVSSIATLDQSVKPRQINKFQQLNSAKIQGALVPGVSINAALKVLEKKASEILPAGYIVDYAGESRQLRKEGNALLLTLLFAMVLIFLVLAAQFESFRDPTIILFGSVPLAIAGALLWTFLGLTTLNIYSQIGLVTLVGLVAKNGILIVEFANHLRMEGMDKFAAVKSAAIKRFRPVLMTSVATVVGHFPLTIASGAGAGARNSIGIVLVTGMSIGTLFTLFVVPATYTFIAKNTTKVATH
jgi:multidrug efflux pump